MPNRKLVVGGPVCSVNISMLYISATSKCPYETNNSSISETKVVDVFHVRKSRLIKSFDIKIRIAESRRRYINDWAHYFLFINHGLDSNVLATRLSPNDIFSGSNESSEHALFNLPRHEATSLIPRRCTERVYFACDSAILPFSQFAFR